MLGGALAIAMCLAVLVHRKNNYKLQEQQEQQQPRQQPQQQQQRQGGSADAGESAPAAAVHDNVAERRRPALAWNRTWDVLYYFGWSFLVRFKAVHPNLFLFFLALSYATQSRLSLSLFVLSCG